MVDFWEVFDRAETGERMEESAFDMKIFRVANSLGKEYHLYYDRENPVPSDNQLADSVWEAGIRAAVDIGIYCTSTKRNIRFTEAEVTEMIKSVKGSTTLGDGKDAVVEAHRAPGAAAKPVICAGIQTVLYSSPETAYRMYKLCAREPDTDGIWQGLVTRINGKYEVRANRPSEIFQYRKEVELMRRAIADAERPGMFISANAPSAAATIGMCDPLKGIRPTDAISGGLIAELKVSFDELNRMAFALAYGSPRRASHTAVIGGFSGGPDTAPAIAVAGGILGMFVTESELAGPNYVHNRVKSRACRACLWTGSLPVQAFARNSRVPVSSNGCDHPFAGPGTEQYLLEAAAGNIAAVASGAAALTGGTRKFVIGTVEDFGSPLESRWMGEVSKATSGVSPEKANEIVKNLLLRYETRLERDAPFGYTFQQLYDMEAEKPIPAYQEIYQRIRDELQGFGLRFGKR
jgi:methylamine--corrinoid protein Co-methyltransferase